MVLAACDCHSHTLQHYWHQWHNVNQVHDVIVCKLLQENIVNVQKCTINVVLGPKSFGGFFCFVQRVCRRSTTVIHKINVNQPVKVNSNKISVINVFLYFLIQSMKMVSMTIHTSVCN